MNEINLKAFQFEFDLTWMSFFQNAEGKTYARYGGREADDAGSHMTKKSLVSTMQRVLKLHEEDAVKPWSKYDPEPKETFTPEQIPPMKVMLGKRKESCIHCHDVKNATLYDREDNGRLKKTDVFTYPSPVRLGVHLDSDDQTRVKKVDAKSAAANAGIKDGDVIETVDGQRILTFGDVTRVLELAPKTGSIVVKVKRRGMSKDFTVTLADGWRTTEDPSWRASPTTVGPNSGFWARPLSANDMRKRKLGRDDLALRVVVVWGAWAKKAGVRNGDVVVEIDGIKTKMGIRQLQTHLQMNRDYGDTVSVKVLRGGKVKSLTMTLPAEREVH